MNGPPMQKPSTRNLLDAQVVHQPEMVVGVGVPGPVDLDRAGRLAAVGVAQIGRDAAVLVGESLIGLKGWRCEARDGRIQPAARDDQQRKATGFFNRWRHPHL